ncbi:MAG: hypothetical protein A3F72_12795 [Bacteroidetes bacterium RIFCSPLOWO2_12_FULL_35_15]|nr:MAG: hypothetical protein A3F72_12795 [Bacteroidetes bacterium RIFCSPLOWO2_12_FULL_35_15]
MTSNYFLKTIQTLRKQEEIILFGNILLINDTEASEVVEFLKIEYHQEALEYPFEVPDFDADAALWAAKTIYTCTQLVLYRENRVSDLAFLLPDFSNELTPSAILSCDLCYRFMPEILVQLKIIDSEDDILPILEKQLLLWHYSGIHYPLETEKLDFQTISSNNCLQQLYMNRIIEYKKINLAKHQACKSWIEANLGIFTQDFWNELKLEKNING